jgi:tRNA dimethylallyltransferase
LHQRIAWRFEQMLQQGFVDEVRRLYQRGDLHTGLPSIRAVGYRQVWEYLDGLYDYDSMRERGIIATRQLAKRQITWLRSWPDLHWLETDSPDLLTSALKILEANAIFSELP